MQPNSSLPQPLALSASKLTRYVIACCLMLAVSIASLVFKPKPAEVLDVKKFDLELVVPKAFGEWRFEPKFGAQVVNPQTKELLDKIYSQILTRTYVNDSGEKIMLSIAYGSDQRGSLQAHTPEVCYPAQGFAVSSTQNADIATPEGPLSARRVATVKGPRHEPVTYWFTVGDQRVTNGLERRIAGIKALLTGRIPDGLLFRVSSIDRDTPVAYATHDKFINQMLSAVPNDVKFRLAGLGAKVDR
jgi:EpsI family protein